jgi:hypothetical protein
VVEETFLPFAAMEVSLEDPDSSPGIWALSYLYEIILGSQRSDLCPLQLVS